MLSYSLPQEISSVQALSWFKARNFKNTPPYFLSHWKTNKNFFVCSDVLIAYEEASSHLVVAGEPLAQEEKDLSKALEAFLTFAKSKNKKVCGYYVGQSWSHPFFSKVSLGTSSLVLLDHFNLSHPESREVRRALRKGEALNYKVILLQSDSLEDHQRLEQLFNLWKKSKAPFDISFLLSSLKWSHLASEKEKFYLLEKQGEPIAFCSLLPYFKNGTEQFYTDHLVHHPSHDSHALSYLISYLMVELKGQGVEEFNLGLNPFVIENKKEHPMESLFAILYKFPLWYRPQGLHFFKTKFPGIEKKEYCFFQKEKNSWFALADMVRLTLVGTRG